jgi:hypothetical protein
LLYGKLDPNWLTFDPEKTGFLPNAGAAVERGGPTFKDASENFFVYRDIYTGLTDDPEFRALSTQHLQTALTFDGGLLTPDQATYMHPTTFIVSSGALDTRGKIRVDFITAEPRNGVAVVRSELHDRASVDGDQTVPSISSNPQRVSTEPKRQEFGNIEHSDVPNQQIVINHVLSAIDGLF